MSIDVTHRNTRTAALAAVLASAPATAFAQSGGGSSDPAGGAALGEVVLATGMTTVVTAIALAVVLGHRAGRFAGLGRLAGIAERVSGVPGWASLPFAVNGGALVIAVVGMYWDISVHIDNGRDPGPLANPAHYLILFGLFGIFIAGLLACALPLERPCPTAIPLTSAWYAPLGGALMVACAGFALTGFPLDDVWHRLFGQDVTLWGPTHLMLIGGAAMSVLATAMLVAEGLRAASGGRGVRRGAMKRFLRVRQAMLAGALLVGLSTVQAEFDFGVPQFRLLYHPVLLMLAASVALVAARIWIGRGGALMALAGYLGVRIMLSLVVGEAFGETMPHFPLYTAEAVACEAVALLVDPRRPVVYGAAAGAAIGTFGLAAEWGWSHVWVVNPWPASLLPEGLVLGLLAAVAGGVLGGAVGRALAPPAEELAPSPRWAVAAAMAAALVAIAHPLPISSGDHVKAQIALDTVTRGDNRLVDAEVRLDPADAADGAEWFNATAWQGGGAIVERMQETGPGVYRTTEPLPVSGDWKVTLRLHTGSAIQGVPIYMPEDTAIPADEVPAEASMTRAFLRDKQNLQREQKSGVPGFLTLAAYLVVLAMAAGILAALTIALMRLDRDRERMRDSSPGGDASRFTHDGAEQVGARAAGAVAS